MLKDKVGFSAAPCFVYLQNRKIPLPPFGPLLPSGAPFLPVIGLDSFHDITPPPPPGSGCWSGVSVPREVKHVSGVFRSSQQAGHLNHSLHTAGGSLSLSKIQTWGFFGVWPLLARFKWHAVNLSTDVSLPVDFEQNNNNFHIWSPFHLGILKPQVHMN